MTRGRRRENIFYDERDVDGLLHTPATCFELFGLEVHAYAILPKPLSPLNQNPKGQPLTSHKNLKKRALIYDLSQSPVFKGIKRIGFCHSVSRYPMMHRKSGNAYGAYIT
jgi:hypothetical protein